MLLAFIAFFPLFLCGQGKITISGELPDHSMDGSYVYFRANNAPIDFGLELIDSVLIKDGRFYYEGEMTEAPFLADLLCKKVVDGHRINTSSFIMEPGDIRIKITDWEEKADLFGTPINEDYSKYIVKPKELRSRISKPWNKKREEGLGNRTWTEDDEREYVRVAISNSERQWEREARMIFMEKYPHYPKVIQNPLYLFLVIPDIQSEAQHVLDKIPEAYRDSLYSWQANYKKSMEKIRKERGPITVNMPIEVIPEHLQIGKPYIDFTGQTPDGTEMKLSEILPGKKLILLDFWASWCGPCMKEMPVISEVHNKYKDKGLAVVGITSDAKEADWKKAIEKNNMDWLQLITPEGQERIGKHYNVKSIPYTMIIDGDGTILARRLRGAELIAKIDELMARE